MRRPCLLSASLILGGLLALCPASHSDDPIPKPEPIWSTYLGGNASDIAAAVTVDRFGNVLLVGFTESTGWASGGFDPTFNGGAQDVFVAKFSPNGAHLWSTYLGGNNSDAGLAVVADPSGNVCVTGWTRSQGWTSAGFDETYNGGFNDVFVAKLNPDGALLWSTYLGGMQSEMGEGIAVDSGGSLYVTGWTSSPGWAGGELTPSLTAADAVDAFVAKISPAGVLLWSRYVGGGYPDFASDIAVDSSGFLYLTGYASYGFDPSIDPANDAFVMKLSATGGALWRTDLPGVGADQGTAVVVDASGTVYAVGSTEHPGWDSGEIVVGHHGAIDAYVVQLSPLGEIGWTTHLGGGGEDHANDLAFDPSGDLILIGNTLSSGWASGGFDSQHGGGTDAFLVRLSPAGAELWSAYLGGTNEDYGESVAVDGSGGILAAGWTQSSQWIAGGFDVTLNGFFDAFVARTVSEVECPPATVDAKRLLLSCNGGLAAGNPDGTLRLQFHAGASSSQSCNPVALPLEAALVDCEIDPGQYSTLSDCEAVLAAMVAEIGACIEDQAKRIG